MTPRPVLVYEWTCGKCGTKTRTEWHDAWPPMPDGWDRGESKRGSSLEFRDLCPRCQ
jgi:hypothetical protein